MSSQRPFFLSNFLAAFRPQNPSLSPPQTNKHTSTGSSQAYTSTAPSAPRSISSAATAAVSAAASAAAASASQQQPRSITAQPARTGVVSQLPLHSPTRGGGVPIPSSSGRRRGSESSSEGFREVLGAEKWYVGGRTAAGEERFFKLGIMKRVRSNDGLSLDRLSL